MLPLIPYRVILSSLLFLAFSTNVNGATLIPTDIYPTLAQRALDEWAAEIDRHPDLARAIPTAQRSRLPIGMPTIRAIIKASEVSGFAKWCGLSYKTNIDRLKRSTRRYGLSMKQDAYVHMLHRVVGEAALGMIKKDECEPQTRDRVSGWLKRRANTFVNMSYSAANAVNRSDKHISHQLIGVWAPHDSTFQRPSARLNHVLYIGADGIGWRQTPDLGRRVLLDVDARQRSLVVRETENSMVVYERRYRIVRSQQEVTLVDSSGAAYRRVSRYFDPKVRNELGVEPSLSSVRQFFTSRRAQDAFYRIYWPYATHKAFAVSSGGAFGYSGQRMLSRELATKEALRYCNQYRAASTPPCKILSVDGEISFVPERDETIQSEDI